jgi:uroporphyrinogen-III synthase
MRIWVTRAAPEADNTAARLRERGHSPLVAPVLKVRHMDKAPDLAGVGAVAFTSRNGVRAFAALSRERAMTCFAVGGATAQAARDIGFSDVHSADGDALALAELIAGRRASFAGAVLHAAPEAPAQDLVKALGGHGVHARAHVVYRTEPLPLDRAALSALQAEPVELDAVLVHSAQAARHLSQFPALEQVAPDLLAFCISPAAAEPLKALEFRVLKSAPFPNELGLLSLVED